eukprot:5929596-Amphidinium_carterae.1
MLTVKAQALVSPRNSSHLLKLRRSVDLGRLQCQTATIKKPILSDGPLPRGTASLQERVHCDVSLRVVRTGQLERPVFPNHKRSLLAVQLHCQFGNRSRRNHPHVCLSARITAVAICCGGLHGPYILSAVRATRATEYAMRDHAH